VEDTGKQIVQTVTPSATVKSISLYRADALTKELEIKNDGNYIRMLNKCTKAACKARQTRIQGGCGV